METMEMGQQRAYLEWAIDIVVGGDVGVLPRLPEALQRWGLHINDVGSQFMGPHCLNSLRK